MRMMSHVERDIERLRQILQYEKVRLTETRRQKKKNTRDDIIHAHVVVDTLENVTHIYVSHTVPDTLVMDSEEIAVQT